MWRALWLSFLLLVTVPTLSCAATSIQGQVLDAQTGKPVPGAIVLGVWTRMAGLPGLNYTELVGVGEVETDAEGRFTLERPSSRYNAEDGESITVYKFGYVAWNNIFVFPGSNRREHVQIPNRIQLERFPSSEDRRRHLDFISGATRSTLSYKGSKPKFDEAVDRERRMP
jgi:hypothetical protein